MVSYDRSQKYNDPHVKDRVCGKANADRHPRDDGFLLDIGHSVGPNITNR